MSIVAVYPPETEASIKCRPMVDVQVVAQTKSMYDGTVITTLMCRYPRYIHAELMTHRAFSRNASSSRAIPVAKTISQVAENPVIPLFWGSNKPGMQQGDEIGSMEAIHAVGTWRHALDAALMAAKTLADLGVHKQYVNRLLEPFSNITTLVTATEWDNFYSLRCHPMAMPEIEALARSMLEASTSFKDPRTGYYHLPFIELKDPRTGYYHLPFIKLEEFNTFDLQDAILISAARCARVSYLNHDLSEPDPDKDKALAERLLADRHMSPFEHVAQANTGQYANFVNWQSFRNMLEKAS